MIDEEFVEGRDFVKCELCGECMRQLYNHITKVHGITVQRYNELFPNAKISSDASAEAKAEANRNKYRGIENHRYQKRHVYLLPDGTYAPKSDIYKKAWGVDKVNPEHVVDAGEAGYVPVHERSLGVEGEDYVCCAICGEKKGSLSQHIRKFHNMSVPQYKESYPDSPIHCRKVADALSEASKKKWQTQFANGTSTPAMKRERAHHGYDDVTKEGIEQLFKDGYSIGEIARRFGTSDPTIRSRCRKFGIEVPSVTLLHIRRAVRNGAELNLENATKEEIIGMIDNIGKAGTLRKYGVEKDILDTWLKMD